MPTPRTRTGTAVIAPMASGMLPPSMGVSRREARPPPAGDAPLAPLWARPRSQGMSRIRWQQDRVAGVPLDRHLGFVGPVEVGQVAYDGSNRFWVWSSPLQEDAWGYGPTEQAAKTAFELWLRSWLENFRSFLQPPDQG